jgi:hypothetical protein
MARLIAVSFGNIAYVWDITSLDPHPIEIFIGHTEILLPLHFLPPLLSSTASYDNQSSSGRLAPLSIDPAQLIQSLHPII